MLGFGAERMVEIVSSEFDEMGGGWMEVEVRCLSPIFYTGIILAVKVFVGGREIVFYIESETVIG